MKEAINDEDKPSLRNKPSPRERGLSKERAKFLVRISRMSFAVMLLVPVMLGLFMPTASAELPGAIEAAAISSTGGMVIAAVGAVGLVFLGLVQATGTEVLYNILGQIAALCLGMMLAIPIIFGAVVWSQPEEPTEPLITPPDVTLRWMMNLDPDGDVAGATYPAAPFTVCDTAIGGTTGEWETANDNPRVDDVTKEVTTSVHVDTDLSYLDATGLWMEPNCIFVEAAYIKLLEGPESSDGSMATQQYWGRIDSIDYVRPSKVDNDTGSLVDPLYIDAVHVHHIGWQDENNLWLQACSEYQGKLLPAGASCGPVPLGTDDGTGDTIKAVNTGGIRIFWVWEDRGPFSWWAEDGDMWHLTFSIGSKTDWHTYTFIAHYLEDATNNT